MNDKINLYGKVAKFPKNVKASKAYTFLENIRMPKKKLWYFIIEKEIIEKDNNVEEIQVIKYNNKQGVNCKKFVESLKEYYAKDKEICKYIKNLVIDGKDDFSIIRNIPNVKINERKLINIIMDDLIKLLYK